jgi:hypothetical protein
LEFAILNLFVIWDLVLGISRHEARSGLPVSPAAVTRFVIYGPASGRSGYTDRRD